MKDFSRGYIILTICIIVATIIVGVSIGLSLLSLGGVSIG